MRAGLHLPAGTARVRLQLISRTRERPRLKLAVALADSSAGAQLPGRAQAIDSELAPARGPGKPHERSCLPIPRLAGIRGERTASLCLTGSDLVNWAGTPLPAAPVTNPPTVAGKPVAAGSRSGTCRAAARSAATSPQLGRSSSAPRCSAPGSSARGSTCCCCSCCCRRSRWAPCAASRLPQRAAPRARSGSPCSRSRHSTSPAGR